MGKKVKTIDGFTPRRSGANRIVGTQQRNGRKITVGTPKRSASEEFLSPIGTFDLTSDDVEKDIKKAKKNKKQKKVHKKWSKKRKIITGIIIFLIVLLVGGVAFVHFYLEKLTGGNIGLWDVFTAKDVELKKGANGRTNILVLGTSGYEMNGSGHDGAQLTDSIMVLSLDQENKDIAMMSLPRDLKVNYTCTGTGKVNEIYWCANQDGTDEIAGVTAAQEEIGDILGLDFQYYVHVDWGALVQVVDAVGGITVTLDEDIFDDWTNTFITAGVPTTLNGEEALGLARARHGTYAGDFTRGASQQKILIALKDKVVEQGLSVGQLFDLMNALGDNVRMDFNADELKTLYNIMKDFNMDNIRQVTLLDAENGINLLTTGTINGISYVLPTAGEGVYTDIRAYLKQQFSNDPVAREGAKILVLNGSGTVGAASTEKEKLEDSGYTVIDIDDAPTDACSAKYCVYAMNDEKSATAEALKKYYNKENLKAAGDLTVQLYNPSLYDFVVIVGANN